MGKLRLVEVKIYNSDLALHSKMRFCTAESVDVSFCPVIRCLSIITCIPSGSLAGKTKTNYFVWLLVNVFYKSHEVKRFPGFPWVRWQFPQVKWKLPGLGTDSLG